MRIKRAMSKLMGRQLTCGRDLGRAIVGKQNLPIIAMKKWCTLQGEMTALELILMARGERGRNPEQEITQLRMAVNVRVDMVKYSEMMQEAVNKYHLGHRPVKEEYKFLFAEFVDEQQRSNSFAGVRLGKWFSCAFRKKSDVMVITVDPARQGKLVGRRMRQRNQFHRGSVAYS
jgi:hypothetical protein